MPGQLWASYSLNNPKFGADEALFSYSSYNSTSSGYSKFIKLGVVTPLVSQTENVLEQCACVCYNLTLRSINFSANWSRVSSASCLL